MMLILEDIFIFQNFYIRNNKFSDIIIYMYIKVLKIIETIFNIYFEVCLCQWRNIKIVKLKKMYLPVNLGGILIPIMYARHRHDLC